MTDSSFDGTRKPLLSPGEVEDVFKDTEEVRDATFPDVPAELLAAVLAAEQTNLDNRTDAARAVARVIDEHLAAEGNKRAGGDA
ncbi:hypothetical protein [Amycolatopsis sp. cmx-4-68]|uniref:hypothetical protein n=1 Tax=Amycolatopsis sp. cmx-4-68 TaxID=2790938 RepID=UPI0039783F50